jgi:aldehyde dehydrogenase (NAD+)
MGKSLQEYGEVQEMIDICDFAVSSRQLHGLTMHLNVRDTECGIAIPPNGSCWNHFAFNFPVAVWAWNTFSLDFVVMFVFGNHLKKRHLCGIACQ